MRIAFLNRKRDTHVGGDITQIDATMQALTRRGIECHYAHEGWTIDWLRGFDLAHVFHINFSWSTYNWSRCVEARVPYVLTPIFYPDTALGADAETMRRGLYHASYVTPNSHREYEELLATLAIQPIETFDYPAALPIPNGTDRMFVGPCTAAGRAGVICVTPRAGDKNTAVVQHICASLGFPYRCVSGIGDREELAHVYRRARVFVNASLSERMSLTTGEALVAGCRVIDTVHNRGNSWYGEGLAKVDPRDRSVLRAQLDVAYNVADRDWDYSPNRAAQRLTWDVVADQLARVYRRVLT
jgi:hypothetical protein